MAKFHIYEDTQKQYRWRLVARNGRIMADSSEGYVDEPNAREAAERFKQLVPDAIIVDAGDQDNG